MRFLVDLDLSDVLFACPCPCFCLRFDFYVLLLYKTFVLSKRIYLYTRFCEKIFTFFYNTLDEYFCIMGNDDIAFVLIFSRVYSRRLIFYLMGLRLRMVFTQYIFRFIINLFNEFVISWVCYVSNFTKFYNIVSYNLMFTNKNVWGKDSSIV